jgi:phosphoglycerate dehydrogenase-like enzyme
MSAPAPEPSTEAAESRLAPGGAARPVVTVPDERWLGLWPPGQAPVEVVLWDLVGPAPVDPSLVVTPYLDSGDCLRSLGRVPSLRVVQTLTAGYEGVLPHLPPGVLLCNAAGVHDASTAELAVGLAIAGLRGLGDSARAQPAGQWLHTTRPSLADRSVLLLGAGGVGAAVARRLAGFEVRLTRVASRDRVDELGRVHAVSQLPQLLPDHDVVILTLPLVEATRGLVDAAFLAAMPDGALLVNVARGPIVVTDALVAELTAGRLSAALDVTDPEPLPPGHPLWSAPNVLISPHVGGDTSAFPPRARALLRDQFGRFAAGEPLANLIPTS